MIKVIGVSESMLIGHSKLLEVRIWRAPFTWIPTALSKFDWTNPTQRLSGEKNGPAVRTVARGNWILAAVKDRRVISAHPLQAKQVPDWGRLFCGGGRSKSGDLSTDVLLMSRGIPSLQLVYRMLKFGHEYSDIGQDLYEQRYKQHLLKRLAKNAKDLGFHLVPSPENQVP